MISFLGNSDIFPSVKSADKDGILAVGGDLSVNRLITAYSNGIFPWYSHPPIIWWAPDPRFVIFPDKIKISRSMKKILKSNVFQIVVDSNFFEVINKCSNTSRPGQDGTWITDNMISAYVKLHAEGYAHSVEAFHCGNLVGGLYGISLGGIFFGESMFTDYPNASKAAFISLAYVLRKNGFNIIDSQIETVHVKSLGGENISRDEYMHHLKHALTKNSCQSKWDEMFNDFQTSSIFQ